MICSHCANDYDKSFQVILPDGESFTFDSFECAIATLAKECASCGCRILGHGLETAGAYFCCANCAELHGEPGFVDRIR